MPPSPSPARSLSPARRMPARTRLGLLVLFLSFASLVPGLFAPLLTVEVSPTLPFVGKVTLHQETRSILGTVQSLYRHGYALVASLILLFSVLVPLFKGLGLFGAFLFRGTERARRLGVFIGLISKWSMADVFVAGILTAFLSARAAKGMSAELHWGFYCFLLYCLLSILSTQLLEEKRLSNGEPVP